MPKLGFIHCSITYPGLLCLAYLILLVYQIHLIPLLEPCSSLLELKRHIIFHTLFHRIKYPGKVVDSCLRPELSAAGNPFYLPCSQIVSTRRHHRAFWNKVLSHFPWMRMVLFQSRGKISVFFLSSLSYIPVLVETGIHHFRSAGGQG